MLNSITQALDESKMAGAVTTDLSSAFDCMPPNLMYHKLIAYGFTHQAALLIHSYLTHRSQKVKKGSVVGEWLPLAKGTPQGSKLGPALRNLFNDLLYTLPQDSVVNFADDNTLYAVEGTPQGLESKLIGRNLNILKRVAHSLPTKVKLLLYNAYISCHFNFCPLVWHFCSVANTKKLGRLQYRAL